MVPVNPTTLLRRGPDHMACDLDSETVLLDIVHGRYYHMNRVAARIWTLLEEPSTPEALSQALLAEYDVDEARCRAEVLDVLRYMQQEGLIVS